MSMKNSICAIWSCFNLFNDGTEFTENGADYWRLIFFTSFIILSIITTKMLDIFNLYTNDGKFISCPEPKSQLKY